MNTETKSFCWSCGNSLKNCICGSENVPIELKKPKEILPICGTFNEKDLHDMSNNIDTYPWLDRNRWHEILPRPCCKCEQAWGCTHSEWLNGTCPHCGANGQD